MNSNSLGQQPSVPVIPPSPSRARLWWAGGTFLVVLIAIVLVLFQHLNAAAQPKVTWSTPSLDLTLSPGDTMTRVLTLTSDTTIKNVQLEAVPVIAPFLTIQPTSIATLTAKQVQTITVSFKIPSGATPGSYDGTIHVRSGSQTLPQTIRVGIAIWRLFTDQSDIAFLYPGTFRPKSDASGNPASLTAWTVVDHAAEQEFRVITYRNLDLLPPRTWFTQVLQGHEYSGERLVDDPSVVSSIAEFTCNDSAGIVVRGRIFEDWATRVFCVGPGQIVEFEATGASGVSETLLLQVANTYSSR